MVNGIHPDLPLRLFAAGHLGIIQPGYAKSYLIVSYRYLTGAPLEPAEQASILALWHHRLYGMFQPMEFNATGSNTADPRAEYIKLRARVLGLKFKDPWSIYDFRFADNVLSDAFLNALTNLRALIKQFGDSSSQVKDWLNAQDKVFGVDGLQSDPAAAGASAALDIKTQRAYQIAAARFYANELDKAGELFEAIAKDSALQSSEKGSHLRDLAWYMAARSKAKAALDANDSDQLEDALKYTREIIARNASSYCSDLEDLCDAITYQLESESDSLDRLVKLVVTRHGDRFGNAVGDLTYLLSSFFDDSGNPKPQEDDAKTQAPPIPIEKYDLTDWLMTIHQPDQTWSYYGVDEQKQLALQQKKRAVHALERWRSSHSLPWFVAALSLNDLSDKSNHDLFIAATKSSSESKAFLTAKFYLADALIKSNRKAEADKLLRDLLASKEMPPSTRNLFMCQRLMASRSVNEYLTNIVQRPAEISSEMDASQLPADWQAIESRSTYYSCDQVIADTLYGDLNANLPQAYWLKWCNDNTISKPLRSRIILAAWLRSKLLGQEAGLDDLLVAAYPSLKKAMESYKSARSGPEKRFALACLIICNWGMTPYLDASVARHSTNLGEWDGFKANFWLPLPPQAKPPDKATQSSDTSDSFSQYRGSTRFRSTLVTDQKPVLRNLLNAKEKDESDAERLSIWKNHPSYFLGEPIIAWARLQPKDARVPEMLYHLVKLPRWSPARTDIGSKYSHTAYLLLHKQYPNSVWAQKADYWY